MSVPLDYRFALCELGDPAGLSWPGKLSSAIEDRRPISAQVICSVGVDRERSPLLIASIEGERGKIVNQIAVKMSADAIFNTAASYFEANGGRDSSRPLASALVREAFKEANQQVYQYVHRMAAGGRGGANGFIAAFDGLRFSIAKVGGYASYLYRGNNLVSLHEQTATEDYRAGVLQRFIGANAQILVDFASTQLEEGDVLALTTIPDSEALSSSVKNSLSSFSALEKAAEEILSAACKLNLVSLGETKYLLERNMMIVLLQVGRPVIRLTHALRS